MELLFILLFLYFLLFLLSVKIKDNSIVDIFWGIGFIIISVFFYLKNSFGDILSGFVLLLLLVWGFRLSYYIFKRKIKEKKEDARYAKWRKKWKYFYLRSFFQVFILQMFLMILVSIPLYFIFSGEKIDLVLFLIGAFISIIGLLIEIISDKQVEDYIRENGKSDYIFTGGLYKYSRNPNYFGESLFWLGISIIGFSVSYLSIIGFIVITSLLLFVSGVPMKEKSQEKKKNYLKYKQTTSLFIPWFPRKK